MDSKDPLRGKNGAGEAPIKSNPERTSMVYFASAEEVSEGFAIALRAMGFEEVLLSDIIPPDAKPPDE